MSDDEKKLAEKSQRQFEELKKANPEAKVEVDNRREGNVEVNTVKVSTEKKS